MYYTETLLGESDHMLLSIIETLVEGVQIPVLTEGAPYVYMYTMSVTFLNHLRSRIALSSTKLPAVVSSQMSAKLKGQDRRRLDDTSKQGIRSSAGVPDKTRGEGAERVLEDHDTAQCGEAKDPVQVPPGLKYMPQRSFFDSDEYLHNLTVRGDDSNGSYLPDKMVGDDLTSAMPTLEDAWTQQASYSSVPETSHLEPDSSLWDDFLKGEMMMLDQSNAITAPIPSFAPDLQGNKSDLPVNSADHNRSISSYNGLPLDTYAFIDENGVPRLAGPWLAPTVGHVFSNEQQFHNAPN